MISVSEYRVIAIICNLINYIMSIISLDPLIYQLVLNYHTLSLFYPLFLFSHILMTNPLILYLHSFLNILLFF